MELVSEPLLPETILTAIPGYGGELAGGGAQPTGTFASAGIVISGSSSDPQGGIPGGFPGGVLSDSQDGIAGGSSGNPQGGNPGGGFPGNPQGGIPGGLSGGVPVDSQNGSPGGSSGNPQYGIPGGVPSGNDNTDSGSIPGAVTGSEPPLRTGSVVVPTTSGAVTTVLPTSSEELDFGLGIPTGTVTDLPDDQFIFLAVSASSTNPLVPTEVSHGQGGVVVRRQAQEPAIERRPLKLVDLESPDEASDNVSQEQCDSADPLLLRMGSLVQYDYSVGKPFNETLLPLGFLIPPPGNQIDQAFTLLDGVLQWNATDVGNALFFSCNGQIVAAFDEMVPPGCTQVVVGAIAGDACQQRVEQTRTPIATFTAPRGESPTSSLPGSVTWTPNIPSTVPTTSSAGGTSNSLDTTQTPSVTSLSSGATGSFTNSSVVPSTQLSSGVSTLPSSISTSSSTVSSTSTCNPALQTQDNAINSRMSEALLTGNPDIVTEEELLQQVPVSLDGRQTLAFDIVPNDTTVTWLLNPNTGFVRNPGVLDVLLKGTTNTVQTSNPANKTLAAVGVVPDVDARIA